MLVRLLATACVAHAALITSTPDATALRQSVAVRRGGNVRLAAAVPASDSSVADPKTVEPLLLRAARGEKVERSPVWMMRQAGRHMAVYRALVSQYPTFR